MTEHGRGAPSSDDRARRSDGRSRRSRPARDGRADAGAVVGGRTPPQQPRKPRREEPALPEDVTGWELDRAVRGQLSSLADLNATTVARHLVMTARLLEDDPETAYQHAKAAASRAGRIGAVREAAGLAAYRSGHYAEGLSELRAARRMTGDTALLPVMADCERGLGRPERALEMSASPEAAKLDAAGRLEMLIVSSGARRDMGQPEAAVVALQVSELQPRLRKPWSARLFYAYADALLAAGRGGEARTWFEHAADADALGDTDAAERLAELDGVTFLEPEDEADGPAVHSNG